MQRRLYKPFWLFLALLFAGQALLPVSSLAEVRVRCVGASASAKPCAQGLFVVADMAHIARRFAGLPCCRNMKVADCPSRAIRVHHAGRLAALSLRDSPSRCLVTIHAFRTGNAVAALPARLWLLRSAPAQAPPAFPPVLFPGLTEAAFPAAPTAFILPSCSFFALHGPRAPPSA